MNRSYLIRRGGVDTEQAIEERKTLRRHVHDAESLIEEIDP